MFHEYRDEIAKLKQTDAHFERIFNEHNELDQKITNAENGINPIPLMEIDNLKKQKLLLKDQVYAMIREYKDKSER